MSLVRILVVAMVLAGGILSTRTLETSAAPIEHRPLQQFPAQIPGWQSRDLPFDADVEKAVGADDYINREYSGGPRPVELYIGYYRDQRSGDAIHSPQNCLPGEGWEPVRSARLQLSLGGHPVPVNEYIVEQGAERDLVLYWYQAHGRVVASEYAAKFWLVADGVRGRGTDGAMIRIWTTAEDGEGKAEARAIEFARRMYPQVSEFLPG
jgi:EpsI family protein